MCYRVLHRPVNVTCAPISIIFCLLESPTATRSRPGFRPQNSHPACCGVSYRQARAEHRRRSRRTSVLDFHKGKGQDRIGKQASKQTLVAARSKAIHKRLHLRVAREPPPGGGTHRWQADPQTAAPARCSSCQFVIKNKEGQPQYIDEQLINRRRDLLRPFTMHCILARYPR
jgi:hypothetical protein